MTVAGCLVTPVLKAQQVRRLIREDFMRAFESVDVIAGPTAPSVAFRLGEKADDHLGRVLAEFYDWMSREQWFEEFFTDEAEFMRTAAKTPRSNCTMNSSKLAATGIKMTEVHEAIERDLRRWVKAST